MSAQPQTLTGNQSGKQRRRGRPEAQLDLFSGATETPPPAHELVEIPGLYDTRVDLGDDRARVQRLFKVVDRIHDQTHDHRTFERCCRVWLSVLDRFAPAGDGPYLEAIKGMDAQSLTLLAQGFGELQQHFRREGRYADLLGPVYMELRSNWGRSSLGQFFTPWHLALAMAEVTADGAAEKIREAGTCSVYDPACGSGVMLLALKGAVAKQAGRRAAQSVLVRGQDIDETCCLMARIQLRLVDDRLMHCFETAFAGELLEALRGRIPGLDLDAKVSA